MPFHRKPTGTFGAGNDQRLYRIHATRPVGFLAAYRGSFDSQTSKGKVDNSGKSKTGLTQTQRTAPRFTYDFLLGRVALTSIKLESELDVGLCELRFDRRWCQRPVIATQPGPIVMFLTFCPPKLLYSRQFVIR